MSASALLDRLTAAGLSVAANGDRLLIQPAAKFSDDLRAAVVAMKPELLVLLSAAADEKVTPKVDGAASKSAEQAKADALVSKSMLSKTGIQETGGAPASRGDRSLERQRRRRATRTRIDYYPSDEALQALESLRRRTVGGNASSTIDRVLVSVGALVPEARA
jgi:TubC N-terminal docking domain